MKKPGKANLFRFRQNLLMTQDEFAKTVGVSRCTYAAVENGRNNGTMKFWKMLQEAHHIPDEEMWRLMQDEA